MGNSGQLEGANMIYFAQVGDDGPIKIGFTTQKVEKRINALQTSNPQKINLLATMNGTYKDERMLHKKFRIIKLKGEWFEPDKILIDYIKRLNQKPKPDALVLDVNQLWLLSRTKPRIDYLSTRLEPEAVMLQLEDK